MTGYLLDTNVFNRLLDGKLSLEELGPQSRWFATAIQHAELARTPDQGRREGVTLFSVLSVAL